VNAKPSTAVIQPAGKILPVLRFAAGVLFQHLLTGQRKPLLASYKLTYHCNLACTQCPFTQYSGPNPSFELVCQRLDALYRRGNRLVVFEGGEPLLWRDGKHGLKDVVTYARQRFACVALTTNGTLPLDIDSDVLWVSIDGFAETHNRLRQAPIFEQVIDHIKESRHPRLYAHITANAENSTEIPELVRFLSGLVKGITIQFYYPYGTEDRLFLSNPQRSEL
jgi:MoaA/NifB/PqqE/SkfB family radical SAM enzyme